MITAYMTYSEAATEIRLEFETIKRRAHYFAKSFESLAIKTKKFPLMHSYFYTTPGKNNCVITFFCADKKHVKNSSQALTFYWEGPTGKTYASLMFGSGLDGVVMIFTPHCLSRFRERFLENRPMTETQFLVEFVQSTVRFISKPVTPKICPNEENLSTETIAKSALVAKPGVFFGEVHNDTTEIVMKTFLTYDMMYPEQIKYLFDAMEMLHLNPYKDPRYKESTTLSKDISLIGLGGKIRQRESRMGDK